MNKSLFGISNPLHKASLLISDLSVLVLAFFFASQWRLKSAPTFASIEFIGIAVILIVTLFLGGAYTSRGIAARPRLPLNTLFTVLVAVLPCLLFIYLLGPERFNSLLGRGVFPVALIGFGLLAVSNRFILNKLFHDASKRRTIVILEADELQARSQDELATLNDNYQFAYLNNISNIDEPGIAAIVLHPNHTADQHEQSALIHLRLAGVPIFSLSDFYENFLFRVPVEEIDNDWFIRNRGFTMLHSSVVIRLKRATDVILALTLACLSIPILIIACLLIKLVSRGPVLFRQTRVGFRGKTFELVKLRTMRVDAEPGGAQWASNDDVRIIRGGRFLRKTRIDELPQVWNILKGEMSLVGPRPERPEFTRQLALDIPFYDLRHVVKPGLTGWAQVCYPYGASKEDALRKLQFDLYYIKNYSLMLDLNILLRTIAVTLKRSGR